MNLKISVVLDVKDDVFRTFLIKENETLARFHDIVKDLFGFQNEELAAVYPTDDEWKKTGVEIPLFEWMQMDDDESSQNMETVPLKALLQKPADKFMYTYDFLKMHRFYVTLLEKNPTVWTKMKPIKRLLLLEHCPKKKLFLKTHKGILRMIN